jgi:hypothetical protein
MENLKITITDDTDKYHKKIDAAPDVIGELNFSYAYCLDTNALEGLCESILVLFPELPVKLDISYSIGNS